MRNTWSSVFSVVVLAISGCAPIDGEAVGTSSEALVLPGSGWQVCSSAPHAIECEAQRLQRTRDTSLFDGVRVQGTLEGDPLEPVNRSCVTVTDCKIQSFPTNACGGVRYVGVNRLVTTAVSNLAAQCSSIYTACSPVTTTYIADDERVWTEKLPPRLACCSGRCVTASPL